MGEALSKDLSRGILGPGPGPQEVRDADASQQAPVAQDENGCDEHSEDGGEQTRTQQRLKHAAAVRDVLPDVAGELEGDEQSHVPTLDRTT